MAFDFSVVSRQAAVHLNAVDPALEQRPCGGGIP